MNNLLKAKRKVIEEVLFGNFKIKEIFMENIEKELVNLEHYVKTYKDIVAILTNEEDEYTVLNNFLTVFVLLNFNSQFEIVNRIKEDETINWIEKIKEKCEEIYEIDSQEDDFNDYLDILNDFFLGKNISSEFGFEQNDGLLTFFNLKEDVEIFQNESVSSRFDDEEIVFNRKNVNQNKNIQPANIIKNPTLLSNKILEREKINKDTLFYLKSNRKFFNAVTHSLFSKFFLKEIIAQKEGDHSNLNKKVLLSFMVLLKDFDDFLFETILKNFKLFVRNYMQDKNYFQENEEDYLNLIAELRLPLYIQVKIEEVLEIKKKSQNLNLLKQQEKLKLDIKHNPDVEKVVSNYFLKKEYHHKFEDEQFHKTLLEEFTLTFFEISDFQKLIDEVNPENPETIEESTEKSVLVNEYLEKVIKLAYFFSKVDGELQKYFFYMFNHFIRKTRLFDDLENEDAKNTPEYKKTKQILILTCVKFIESATNNIKKDEMERKREDIKNKILDAFVNLNYFISFKV